MRQTIERIREWTRTHKRQLAIAAGVMVVVLLIALFGYNYYKNAPNIVYRPLNACDEFTLGDAHALLGKDVINKVTEPTISGDTATSSCSYTDTNRIAGKMAVAAVAIRTGINDKGVQKNKDDFVANERVNKAEAVDTIGDDAYFIKAAGQLNVLSRGNWIIISYGVGNDPSTFTLDDALAVAHYVIPDKHTTKS